MVNADNDSGMHKPGYPGDDVLSVVQVSVGVSGGLFLVFMMLSVLMSGSSRCQALWLAWTDRSYDTSWLSEDLEIDPIMDEPIDKTWRTSASISTLFRWTPTDSA